MSETIFICASCNLEHGLADVGKAYADDDLFCCCCAYCPMTLTSDAARVKARKRFGWLRRQIRLQILGCGELQR